MMMPVAIDVNLLASDLLRSLRGKRTQAAFSRWLGYKTNIAYRWEAGICHPTAAGFLRICERKGLDVRDGYREFFQRLPRPELDEAPTSPQAVAALMDELRGGTPVSQLAARSGYNRSSVSRWLAGSAEPKLPQFLALIEATSRRLLDYVATLVDPATLPSVAARWAKLELARRAAYEEPWSHAVLRALETRAVQTAEHPERAIAERLGIEVPVVDRCLALLKKLRQVHRKQGRWVPREVGTVDTRTDPARALRLKVGWASTAVERMSAGAAGNYGYSLFAVSRRDLQRLRAIHLAYVREMQSVIAASQSPECVALYCAQLLDLTRAPDNALGQ